MRAKWKEAKNTFPKIKLEFCSINDTHTSNFKNTSKIAELNIALKLSKKF